MLPQFVKRIMEFKYHDEEEEKKNAKAKDPKKDTKKDKPEKK